MEPSHNDTRGGVEETTANALIRYLVDHAQYDAALLFTRGQYILYRRDSTEVACKGVSAETLRTAFVQEPVDSGWLPEGVIRWGSGPAGTFMVKFIPPGKRRIHLAAQTAPRMIEPPLPALLFAGVNTTYYVWALRGKTCNPSAQLFHAPFPNVYSDGHICFGNNRPPEVGWKTFDEAWQLFLASPFNADITRQQIAGVPRGCATPAHCIGQRQCQTLPGAGSYAVHRWSKLPRAPQRTTHPE